MKTSFQINDNPQLSSANVQIFLEVNQDVIIGY